VVVIRCLRDQKRMAAETGMTVSFARHAADVRFSSPYIDESFTADNRRNEGAQEVDELIARHKEARSRFGLRHPGDPDRRHPGLPDRRNPSS